MISRRSFLKTGSVLPQLLISTGYFAASAAPSGERVHTNEEIIDLLKSESEEPFSPEVERAEIQNYWFQQPPDQRAATSWPVDTAAYDYAHLAELHDAGQTFELNASKLKQAWLQNSFQIDFQSPRILFGLRGAEIPNSKVSSGWSLSHQVRSTRPDHVHLKCIIGALNTQTSELALFKASTVPCADLMLKYTQRLLACNMLPTGMHSYRVGPHRQGAQPGAFRQQQQVWVLRSKVDLIFDPRKGDDVWDDSSGNLPFDNIHAAILDYRTQPPFFSSAGCQVIAGGYKADKQPIGGWKEFRIAAGLADPIEYVGENSRCTDDGRAFQYCLLTAADVIASSVQQSASRKLLRYGSSGPLVGDLELKLGLQRSRSNDRFDVQTQGALLRWQTSQGGPPTGILTSAQGKLLGLKMD